MTEIITPILMKMDAQDCKSISYIFPHMQTMDFWAQKFILVYGPINKRNVNYMLEYEVMDRLGKDDSFKYALKNEYTNLFKSLWHKSSQDDFLIFEAAEYGNLEIIKFIAEQTEHVNQAYIAVLPFLALNGHLEALRYIVNQGIDVTSRKDITLSHAVEGGHLDIAEFLINRGADVNSLDGNPLMQAVRNEDLDMIRLLLINGANIHEGILRHAKETGNYEVMRLLLQGGSIW